MESQSSPNVAKRILQPAQRPPDLSAAVSRGQLARSVSAHTLRSVGKFSTQLDPAHLTPWQLKHLREQQPDSTLTRRATAYRGLLPSASMSTLPHQVAGTALEASSKRPLPQFRATLPKQRAALEVMSSIPFSEQLADRLKEVDGVSPQFMSLVKRGEWYYRQK